VILLSLEAAAAEADQLPDGVEKPGITQAQLNVCADEQFQKADRASCRQWRKTADAAGRIAPMNFSNCMADTTNARTGEHKIASGEPELGRATLIGH
jgi:uncharacterized protein YecT (DUF1311 family)